MQSWQANKQSVRHRSSVHVCSCFPFDRRSYLGVRKDGAEGRSQVSPECQGVHNEVLLSSGQLHEAGEALEAPVLMVLQINCNLFCNGEVLNHRLQSCFCVYQAEGRVIQSL